MNRLQLIEIVNPILDDLGYELWECEYQAQRHSVQIRLFIDSLGENAFSLDDCMKVGKLLRPILDVEHEMRGQYHLEISSPGLNRRLYTVEQMQRYQGQQVQAKLYAPIDDRKQFKGTLHSATDSELVIQLEDEQELHLALSDVAKINVIE